MKTFVRVALALCAGVTFACSGAGEQAQEPKEGMGSIDQPLWSEQDTSFWPNGAVKICLDASIMDDPQYTSTWRSLVKDWVSTEISPFARIDFTFDLQNPQCPASPDSTWLVLKKGTNTDASVGHTSNNRIRFETFGEASQKNTVLHEFMHVLGYEHEFNRPDDPNTTPCSAPQSPTNPSLWTPWDVYSILTSTYSCHDLKRLSAWDRAGIHRADNYGGRSNTFTAAFSGGEASTLSTDWVNVASSVNPSGGAALTVNDVLVGDFVEEVGLNGQPNEDYPTDDVLVAKGSGWWVSSGGYKPWQQLNGSNVAAASLLIGDFNADGVSDVLRPMGTVWKVSWGGTGSWVTLNTLSVSVPKAQMLVGNFNGTGGDDVLWVQGGGSTTCSPNCTWYLSSNGSGPLTVINSSSAALIDMKVGDFDGTGGTDLLYADGNSWRFSANGTGAWQTLNSSDVKGRDLLVGNFDGLGHDDVFTAKNGTFRVSFEVTSSWVDVASSGVAVSQLRVANFGLGRGFGGNAREIDSVFRH